MRRFKIALLLAGIVMLTACAGNANSTGYTVLVQSEVYSAEKNCDNSAVESDGDDNTENSSETAQADDTAEDTTDAAQPNNTAEDLSETARSDNSTGDAAEATDTDESAETDTIYLKPGNSYQDILDNAYTVITNRGADIVEADDIFEYTGIWEAGIGRSTDEALASIGYMLYDVDGNGIEELIIADMPENDGGPWDNRILLMYSLADDKPVLVIDGWARNRYYLLNDSTFYNEGSGGAAYTIFATYRMAADGISIEVIDYYFSDYRDDSVEEYWLAEGNWGWFHNTTGEWEKDKSEFMEFENEDVPWGMMEDYLAQVKQLDLTFFETLKQ